MHSPSTKVRGAAAGALSAGAKALSLSAHLMEGLSGLLRPHEPEAGEGRKAPDRGEADAPTPEGPGPVSAVPDAGPPPEPPQERAAVRETPTEPVSGVPEHARTHDTHVEALAEKPAAEVIRAVEHLSTDELERLYAHEQGGRKRKTVLAAIERSLAPGGSGQG